MGRFDDSIAQYRKALAIDPNFVNAYQGIAMDLLYQGKRDPALAELATLAAKARTDGERTTGLFAQTIVYADGGQMAKALASVDSQFALAEKTNDVGAMAFACGLKGNILMEMGKPDQAQAEFARGLKLIQGSSSPPEIKDNARARSPLQRSRASRWREDLAAAKSQSDEFRDKGPQARRRIPLWRQTPTSSTASSLLQQKDFAKAVTELAQANSQNPQNLYRMCQAYQGMGDAEKSKDFCGRAANFNSLPAINYAFVRSKAKAGAGKG